jgi:hypothetical protein
VESIDHPERFPLVSKHRTGTPAKQPKNGPRARAPDASVRLKTPFVAFAREAVTPQQGADTYSLNQRAAIGNT